MNSETKLNEATVKDICDELSRRNLNFILVANYYHARNEDTQPTISFGVKQQDVLQSIGMLEAAKSYLTLEFQQSNAIESPFIENEDEFDEDDDDDELDEEENLP